MHQEYAIVIIISLLTFRMLVIVIHEFGHAISALFNSDGKVSVYIGSYGSPEKSFRFQIKRFECFIKYNVFAWKGGLCVSHGKNISWKGRILISLFGPLTTLIFGSIAVLLLIYFDHHDFTKVILFAFAFSCILDFVFNIIPKKAQIPLHDGTFTNNDGKNLLRLWKIRNVYETHTKAMAFYSDQEYEKASELFEECSTTLPEDRELNKITISSYLLAKKYSKAIELQKVYAENYTDSFDVHDYVNFGVIEIENKNYSNALDSFKKASALNPDHVIILNNCGYTLGLLNRHDEAIIDLDKAISVDETFAHAWNNRGFSKLKLGQLEDGLSDIQKSLELDAENAYGYRNLGLYYFYKNDYQQALDLYEKAFSLEDSTHEIQKYIDESKALINF